MHTKLFIFLTILAFLQESLSADRIGEKSPEQALLENTGFDAEDFAKEGEVVKRNQGPIQLFDVWSEYRDPKVKWKLDKVNAAEDKTGGEKQDKKNDKPSDKNSSKNGSGSGEGSDGSGKSAGEGEKNNNTENPLERGAVNAGGQQGGGGARVLQRWWPLCAFLDPSISSEQGNQIIKGVVDKAAKCGVHVKVFAKTVKAGTWGGDNYNFINSQQVKSCNAMEGLDVPAASTTALVPFPLTSAKMCDSFDPLPNGGKDWHKNVAGCAELRSGTSLTDKQKNTMTSVSGANGGKHGTNVATGGVAPSIEVPRGHSAGTVSHEALGHSQFGKPNGHKHGLGIGEHTDQGNGAGGDNWTATGCQEMYAKALPNDRNLVYDPNRKIYYVKPHPRKHWDMTKADPIWPKGMAGSPGLPKNQNAVRRDLPLDRAPQTPVTRANATPPSGHGKKSTPPAVALTKSKDLAVSQNLASGIQTSNRGNTMTTPSAKKPALPNSTVSKTPSLFTIGSFSNSRDLSGPGRDASNPFGAKPLGGNPLEGSSGTSDLSNSGNSSSSAKLKNQELASRVRNRSPSSLTSGGLDSQSTEGNFSNEFIWKNWESERVQPNPVRKPTVLDVY